MAYSVAAMAIILGGIGCSHTPTIGFAADRSRPDDPVWAPVFETFAPARAWLAEQRPDVLVFVYNDHATTFFFDHYAAFALGVGERWTVADEGGGPRALPALRGHPQLAQHLACSLTADEFDLSLFQQRPLDHGCFSPLSMLWPHEPAWPGALVPLAVGVLQQPMPTARRCYRLGRALRRAIESYPEELRVVIVGTGGLSHQVHGERAGFNNPDWDSRFLDLIEHDPESLTHLTHAEYAELGGFESAEVIMWLIMRGALSAQVRRVHRAYCLPSMTGIAVLVLENPAPASATQLPHAAQWQRQRERSERQRAGLERLPGTYPFDLRRSREAYRLNKFLHDLVEPAHRRRFLQDPEGAFEAAQLSDTERALLRARDWRGLIHYGALFFGLEKLAAVLGAPNALVYAGMRGQSLEEFQRTRNAPGALYSVAGVEPEPQEKPSS